MPLLRQDSHPTQDSQPRSVNSSSDDFDFEKSWGHSRLATDKIEWAVESGALIQHGLKCKVDIRKDIYIRNYEVSCDEKEDVEFKHYQGRQENIWIRILAEMPKYISGYLNTDGGCMFFGINDSREVCGTIMGAKYRDLLRIEFDKLIWGQQYKSKRCVVLEPPAHGLCTLTFCPVYKACDDKRIVDDTYIIKLIVKSPNRRNLLYTVGGDAYEKGHGSCSKMTVQRVWGMAMYRRTKGIIAATPQPSSPITPGPSIPLKASPQKFSSIPEDSASHGEMKTDEIRPVLQDTVESDATDEIRPVLRPTAITTTTQSTTQSRLQSDSADSKSEAGRQQRDSTMRELSRTKQFLRNLSAGTIKTTSPNMRLTVGRVARE